MSTGIGQRFITMMHQRIGSRDCLDLKNIRKEHLIYMLIFPLAPIFANLQTAIFPNDLTLFGLDAMTLAGSAYCIGAGSLFALSDSKETGKMAKILASVTGISYLIWLIIPMSTPSIVAAMIFAAGLGGCAAGLGGCAAYSAYSYTFILNNSERFVGAAMISLFFSLSQLDFGLSLISARFPKLYLTFLVLGTCICLLRYRTEDFPLWDREEDTRFNPAILLTLYFFIAHYFVEIFYTYLPGSSSKNAVFANGLTGLFVVLLSALLLIATKRSVWNMCSIFFIAVISSYALYFAPSGSLLYRASRYIHGFEQMGYIAAYYLLGCVFKKQGSFRLFRISLITILPLSLIVYVIPGSVLALAPHLLPVTATVASVIVFIVFIMLSPAFFRYVFFADWSDDLLCSDMKDEKEEINDNDENEQTGLLENCGLSPREKEIAALLLKGEITKTIAVRLNISTHTVNFHIKNLYRKLEIGNRAELFARFSSLNENIGHDESGR